MTKNPTKPIELNHCKICNQMTNWLDGVCQKCEPIAIDELGELRELIKSKVILISEDDNAKFFPETYTSIIIEVFDQRTKALIPEILDKFESRIDYNAHDMGEIGIFIRTEYVHNFIADIRAEINCKLNGKEENKL